MDRLRQLVNSGEGGGEVGKPINGMTESQPLIFFGWKYHHDVKSGIGLEGMLISVLGEVYNSTLKLCYSNFKSLFKSRIYQTRWVSWEAWLWWRQS